MDHGIKEQITAIKQAASKIVFTNYQNMELNGH